MKQASLAHHPDPWADPALPHVFACAVASELRGIRAQMEALAEVLVGDSHFCSVYLEHLQTFDLLTQLSDECAHMLERVANGMGVAEAVGAIRLGIMQDRVAMAITQAAKDARR